MVKRASEYNMNPIVIANYNLNNQSVKSQNGGLDMLFDVEDLKLKIKHEQDFKNPVDSKKTSLYSSRPSLGQQNQFDKLQNNIKFKSAGKWWKLKYYNILTTMFQGNIN